MTRSRLGSAALGNCGHTSTLIASDIITVSKALSGGYIPVGAMISTTAISDSVYSSMERAVVHSSTFKNNQLAMVAGLATLSVIDDEGSTDRACRTGEAFDRALAAAAFERHEVFHAVRVARV